MRSQGWWVLAGMLFSGVAHAQVDIKLEIEQVMPIPVQASERSLAADAEQIDRTMEAILGETQVLRSIDDVPRFEEQAYDARTYMASCPPGQYPGCMLVVAQRLDEIDWAIGGVLEPTDLGAGEKQLTVHIIDVNGSREVMAFGVVVGGATNDSEVLRSVAGLFDSVVAGLAEEVDVRGDLDDPMAQEAFEDRRQRLIAASLAQLEQQLGEVIREDIAMGRLEAPKLTRKDLEEYSDRDDTPPWQKLRMSRASYLRFENSGVSLVDWRRRLRGRLGQILLRANVGGGPGPWGLHHEGRWLRGFDVASGQFVDLAVRQYQEARYTGSSSLQLEVGFGVAPWVEVAGVFGLRNAPFTYRFKQDVDGEPAIPGRLNQTPGGTNEFGGRVQFVPMPTYQVRPTAHVGVFSWQGVGLSPDPPLVDLAAPKATYLQLGAGAELSAGRYLNLFLRGHKNVQLAGTFFDELQQGEVNRLENFEEPLRDARMGWGIQVGFQVRISLLKDPSGQSGPSGSFEEDELDL